MYNTAAGQRHRQCVLSTRGGYIETFGRCIVALMARLRYTCTCMRGTWLRIAHFEALSHLILADCYHTLGFSRPRGSFDASVGTAGFRVFPQFDSVAGVVKTPTSGCVLSNENANVFPGKTSLSPRPTAFGPSNEGLFNGLHGKVGMTTVHHLEKCDLGVSGEVDVLCAIVGTPPFGVFGRD